MDFFRMTRIEIEALLRLMAEWERRERLLLMLEWREVKAAWAEDLIALLAIAQS